VSNGNETCPLTTIKIDPWAGRRVPFRVVVKRTQLIKLARERSLGRTITMSAIKAGMSRNTARKDLRQNDVSEQRRVPHTWRTREDPLAAVWPRAEEMLRQAPELEAKALFEHLAQDVGQKERIHPGLLRTFQRRGRGWRLPGGGLDGHEAARNHETGLGVGSQAIPCTASSFEFGSSRRGAKRKQQTSRLTRVHSPRARICVAELQLRTCVF